MLWVRLLRSERACRLGKYPILCAVSCTSRCVTGGIRRPALFRTMETVAVDSPVAFAMSRIVITPSGTPEVIYLYVVRYTASSSLLSASPLFPSAHGYSVIFLARAAYTVVYFARANLLSPETQGKT